MFEFLSGPGLFDQFRECLGGSKLSVLICKYLNVLIILNCRLFLATGRYVNIGVLVIRFNNKRLNKNERMKSLVDNFRLFNGKYCLKK